MRALVDTGAPLTIFGRAIADALDVDMSIGRGGEDRDIRILGGTHPARRATVSLELPPFEGVTWTCDAYFLFADLDLSFAGVLGQEGFLDRWVVSFNGYDGYFVVEERDSFVERTPIDLPAQYIAQFDSEWDRPTPY